MRTIKILLAAGFLLVFGTSIHAQVQRNETYLPKFAIKTNALYWATSTPNLGIEVGLSVCRLHRPPWLSHLTSGVLRD